jgi:hypothetical protein
MADEKKTIEDIIGSTPEDLDKTIKLKLHYRFIKLTNGDDIICQVPEGIETDTLLLVRHPIKVITMVDPHNEDAIYAFTPWVPFTEQELIAVNKMTVVSITTVRDDIKELYMKRVQEYMYRDLRKKTSKPVFSGDTTEPELPEEVDDEPVADPDDPKNWVN